MEEEGQQRDNETWQPATVDQTVGGVVFDDDWLPVDPYMWISLQEAGWAEELKLRVEEEDSGIEPLTDMEITEYAICNAGNTANALKQMKGMQQFRERYNVQDNLEECVQNTRDFIRLVPGFLLHYDSALLAFNFGAANPALLRESEHNCKLGMLWSYYNAKVLQPTLKDSREGVDYLMDAHEMGWHNIDITMEQRWSEEFHNHAPLELQHTYIYNCNTVVNIFFSLVKKIIPQKWIATASLGLSVEKDWPYHTSDASKTTLSGICLQPSYDVAMEKLVQKVRELASLRYRNEQEFTL